jgi:hypothetical protein
MSVNWDETVLVHSGKQSPLVPMRSRTSDPDGCTYSFRTDQVDIPPAGLYRYCPRHRQQRAARKGATQKSYVSDGRHRIQTDSVCRAVPRYRWVRWTIFVPARSISLTCVMLRILGNRLLTLEQTSRKAQHYTSEWSRDQALAACSGRTTVLNSTSLA